MGAHSSGCYHNWTPHKEFDNLDQANYDHLICEWVAQGELQANQSETLPTPTAPTRPLSTAPITTTTPMVTPTAPVSQVQIPSIPGNPARHSVMTGTQSALPPPVVPPRSATMALVTPSPLPSRVTTAASMDSGPNRLLRQLMSNASTWLANAPSVPMGQFQSTNHNTYRITQQTSTDTYYGALVDSGANGRMAGSDTHVLATVPHAHVNITGVGGSVLERLPLVQ